MSRGRVLIADDETAIRQSVGGILKYEDYEVVEAQDGPSTLEQLRKGGIDALLLDVKMPGMDGFEVMAAMSDEGFRVPVVVISGHDAVHSAVEAIKRGAYDFLEKPFQKDELLIRLQNAVDSGRLRRANEELSEAAGWRSELIGASPALDRIKDLIEKVAPTPARVLITGENGTGKELVSRAIHARSTRADGPFVEVNCAAIPEDLIESELFGHEKGAFTGASQRRFGKFERSHRGTLFLDEIGDMSAAAQAKVLRVLEDNRFERVGGHDPIEVDVRVIAATNRDLEGQELGFRQDLFFRLNVIQIHMPPLRERPEDIEPLFRHFLQLAAHELKQSPRSVSSDVLSRFRNHRWPGNVRELRNLAERLAIVASGPEILPADLPPGLGGRDVSQGQSTLFAAPTFAEFKDSSEAAYLQHKLREFAYNVSRTAEELQMQRSNLYKKIQKYGLQTSAQEDSG